MATGPGGNSAAEAGPEGRRQAVEWARPLGDRRERDLPEPLGVAWVERIRSDAAEAGLAPLVDDGSLVAVLEVAPADRLRRIVLRA
ncbi:MAG: hypothetical protein JWN32_2473 [Solirubrobacterales bacterium]|nr:hypothetical protein [Solirubrobacterales bacterium]